ncbi:MAG TPA: VOC family protein [Chloroflexia bacterium]|jgi:catechol 2,3-dioxygenase
MSQTQTSSLAPALLPANTRLGPVHLAVTDARRSLTVWRDLLGLTVLGEEDGAIRLGTGDETLIVLQPGAARTVVPRTSGLYHVAIHVPYRVDLARVVARLFADRYQNSPTDHLVTETTYLSDPDGNGIEVTFETPHRGRFDIVNGQPAAIDTEGNILSGREPVDLESLFGELGDIRRPDAMESLARPLPVGTRVGHVHLHVADLQAAMHFYSDLLGFQKQFLEPRFQMGDVTLPNYVPHIIAFNTWAGRGAPPAPAGASGLRHFTITLPDHETLAGIVERLEAAGVTIRETKAGLTVHDPAHNAVLLTVV